MVLRSHGGAKNGVAQLWRGYRIELCNHGIAWRGFSQLTRGEEECCTAVVGPGMVLHSRRGDRDCVA